MKPVKEESAQEPKQDPKQDAKITTLANLKQRQMLKIILFGSIFVAIVWMAVTLSTPKPQASPPDLHKDAKKVLEMYQITSKTPEDVWVVKGEQRLDKQDVQFKEMTDKMIRLENDLKRIQEQKEVSPSPAGTGIAGLVQKGFSPQINPSSLPPLNEFPVFEKGQPVVIPGQPGAGGSSRIPGATPVSLNNDGMSIKVITSEAGSLDALKEKVAGEKESQESKDGKKEVHILNEWMPTGSFMPGILLSGLDAPTGGQSQNNPHPVLIEVTHIARLPNRFSENVDKCFIIGAGYGDISSERAYIRTETLSCVMKNGRTIDVPVKGYIAGEDGKNGMRGRLVSKEGQIIAKALLAGFASGIGSAFQQTTVTQSISPLGTTQTVDPNQALRSGAYGGVSQSMNMLAQHYIKLAEQTFPIIEIDAGRRIDVVITKGFEINLDQIAENQEKEEK